MTVKNIKETERYINGPRIKVNVTQEIIDQAIASNSAHCVIADAIKCALAVKVGGRYSQVTVDLSQIRVTDNKLEKRFIYFTPQKCQRCIAQFDQGKRHALVPFAFNLRNPVQVVNKRVREGIDVERHEKAVANGRKGGLAAQKLIAKIASKSKGPRRKETQKKNGNPMPLASPLGHRRQFGIKGLGDLDAPTA